ncbi:unnamed protein product [Diatraea saccharalis]|uniref:Uncharacterized protein n=1 Tax=Diatraea saccharalis TaxID=40085 RepID=A0A9N9R437_9NEOP|nr:unnamed protein product [Diatraea saccharalis]
MSADGFITKYGQCRCCSIEGNHQDLFTEYCWESIPEVYSDIFAECFNLCLSTNPELTTLICSNCISKLRDASSFRILVVNNEKQLLEALQQRSDDNRLVNQDENKNSFDNIKIEEPSNVKVESWLLRQSDDDYTDSEKSEIFEDRISSPVKCLDLVDGESTLLSRFPGRQLRPLPTRASLKHVCRDFEKHLKELKGKVIPGKTIQSLLDNDNYKSKEKIERSINSKKQTDVPKKKRIQKTKYRDKHIDIEREKNPYTLERLSHATNITALLEFSNVTAFKSKHQRAYPCFYCEKLYEDFEELRRHQISDHVKENLSQCVLKKYRIGKPDGLVVYADVTDLKCTICYSGISSLKDLKIHLTEVHKKKMFLELSDRVIPFKVLENNFVCQICGNFYETFGSIERHMNTHYRNYVCEECDSGFITKQRLRIHGYLMHTSRQEKYECEICQKQFTTQQKRRIHVETVHENVKKYKCNRCPERFNEYFRRHKHMVLVHGVAPIEYKCNVCDKSFDRRYSLSTHMRTHIQQKDVYCELCPYRCFTKVELRHHMVKHNGERIYECSICKKSYAREKTLKEHMRIHTNDRRYVCPVCGMAFIQNCSLKSHIKSHHKEYGLT